MPETSAEVERDVAYIRSESKVNDEPPLASWRHTKAKKQDIRRLIAFKTAP
jgi:hypothetical protein